MVKIGNSILDVWNRLMAITLKNRLVTSSVSRYYHKNAPISPNGSQIVTFSKIAKKSLNIGATFDKTFQK